MDLALLTLKDIGKIYVAGGTVAVGIRGVNLSFDKGEFVAVTGKSGSGKSTLLNVISGMDSYEEGELTVNGQSTSHFTENDRELYREKYISFIFQDYNIIESFTVLENVELALMHIKDKKERRRRAKELLGRVGMTKFLKHKGSKLSGGQKQRTVIARALAKDSPIILADEPTGNLDSATSAEIIELLKEVSKDKLLIMVTHNFEQVEAIATRHIRIFDGAVESDHVLADSKKLYYDENTLPKSGKKQTLKHEIKNGITLGLAIFKSKPKLSFFMCILLIIATLGTFLMTSTSSEMYYLFQDNYMFTHIDGRMVIVRQDGKVMTDEELQKLCDDTGAKSFIHFDRILDYGGAYGYYYQDTDIYVELNPTFGEHYGEPDIGRYPEAENEAFLYIPISYQQIYGKNELKEDIVGIHNITFNVVGVKYYYDNNLAPEALLTSDGYRTVNAAYLSNSADLSVMIYFPDVPKDEQIYSFSFGMGISNITVSDKVEDGKMYIRNQEYLAALKVMREKMGLEKDEPITHSVTVNGWFYSTTYDEYDYMYETKNEAYNLTLDENVIAYDMEAVENDIYNTDVVVSPSLFREIIEGYERKSYTQASLFYENDKAAHDAVEQLKSKGYIAVPSDTVCEPALGDVIVNTISAVGTAVLWVITIVFLAFFVNLCTSRAIGAFKGEMAIMRSMGIRVNVIKIAMYTRMFISLVPSFIAVIAVAFGIFTSPKINALFSYMYWWQYLIIFAGMILLVSRITHKQIRKLFDKSVKKSLKGGETK